VLDNLYPMNDEKSILYRVEAQLNAPGMNKGETISQCIRPVAEARGIPKSSSTLKMRLFRRIFLILILRTCRPFERKS
jgi:hypothetical protein